MKYFWFLLNRLSFVLILSDYLKFRRSERVKDRFAMRLKDIWPCAFDKTANTDYDRHYIYHPVWATSVLLNLKPKSHVDISSILSFSTVLSTIMPVEFYDYRPAKLTLDNFKPMQQDLMKLSFESGSLHSLSCMHTVEHVGLGRYGDKIDYDGDLKAMKELARVLAPGGHLLFVVPVGNLDRIQFNAHRVYRPDTITRLFSELGLQLKEFTLIPEREEDGGLVKNPSPELIEKQKYACGCFLFTKSV